MVSACTSSAVSKASKASKLSACTSSAVRQYLYFRTICALLYWCKSTCFTGTKVQILTPQSVLAGSVRAADFDTQAISIILNSLSKAECSPSPQVLPLYMCPHTTVYVCPHILYMLSHYPFFFSLLNSLAKPACFPTPQVLAHLQEAVRALPPHDEALSY